VTARKLWDLLDDPDAGHVLDNFRIAAGLQEGEHQGTNWQDEWLYKWLEGASCLYRITGDAWLKGRMDEAIELIGSAQEDDGYVSTQITAPGKPRFQDPREHEIYNMGHLLTAGVTHRRMVGSDALIEIAIRVADFPKPGSMWDRREGICGTDQIQDRVQLRESSEVVGHNVFFTYLYTGAADVYLETGDETLREALEGLWDDLMTRKISVNGGVSPMGTGLSIRRDPVVEAVGRAYFIPCADAYNETCGQIGHFMWNYRMLCHGGEARYADAMELGIYNGITSDIGLDGESWWYRNKLRRHKEEHVEDGHNDLAHREPPGRTRICCPSNLLRTMAEIQSYLYSTSDSALWVHHYSGSTVACELNGEAIEIEQVTDYPWDGKVTITIGNAPGGAAAIALRIPGWAEGAAIGVNGEGWDGEREPGTYARIERVWNAGDTIELELPMPPRLLQGHPRVEQTRNQVAIARGPVLYCLESLDLPDGVALDNVHIPSDIALSPTRATDLPFDLVALEGQALYRREVSWDGQLYRKLTPVSLEPIPIRLIPYFAWANRGASAMSVWLPVVLRG